MIHQPLSRPRTVRLLLTCLPVPMLMRLVPVFSEIISFVSFFRFFSLFPLRASFECPDPVFRGQNTSHVFVEGEQGSARRRRRPPTITKETEWPVCVRTSVAGEKRQAKQCYLWQEDVSSATTILPVKIQFQVISCQVQWLFPESQGNNKKRAKLTQSEREQAFLSLLMMRKKKKRDAKRQVMRVYEEMPVVRSPADSLLHRVLQSKACMQAHWTCSSTF